MSSWIFRGNMSLWQTKLREELGWRPRYTDLRAGLIDTIAWYRENTAWWQDAKEKVESTYAAQGQ